MDAQLHPLYIAFTGVALLLVFFGILFAVKTRWQSGDLVRTDGRVIDLEEDESDGNTVYSPIVRFTDHDGIEHTFTDSMASSPAMYTVGELVRVRYERTNPSNVKLAPSLRTSFASLILIGIGAAILAYCVPRI